jgi:selenocysteine lyase/cysteine desulfurase
MDTTQMYELIKKHRPVVVSVTHIPTNSGLVQPVQAVGAMKDEFDFYYIVDACQSVGQMEVDVNKVNCDFLTATCRKFLRGPRGAGFLYASDRILDSTLEPLCIDMQGAEGTSKGIYAPVKTGQRFEDWEFAYALVVGSAEAFKYANQIGLKNIESRTFALAQYTREQLSKLKGVNVLDKGAVLCGIVTAGIENIGPQKLKELLRERQINTSVSERNYALLDFDIEGAKWALRVSPHYYNTYEEIDTFIAALEEILSTIS